MDSEEFASRRGLRYEAEADERWLRAWEPYTTLKVAARYEHALHATGAGGLLSIARAVVDAATAPAEVGTWIAIVQDERVVARAATSSDFSSAFAETLDLVSTPRQATGDHAYDQAFATFAASAADVARAITPSLRRLLLSWRAPVHAELRVGGFVFAPITATPDERGLSWMLEAVHIFGEKATKRAT